MLHDVLHAMQVGQVIDIVALAKALNSSRHKVQQQLDNLQTMHAPLERLDGTRYVLRAAIERLEVEKLRAMLSPSQQAIIQQCTVLDCVESTNQYLLEQAGTDGIRLCVAEYQQVGRGQHGRRWLSPFASGMCLSLQQRRDTSQSLAQLNLAMAACLIDVLNQYGAQDVGLKWPNDIVWRGKKLAGLLLESKTQGKQIDIVVGIGMNIDLRGYELTVDQAWTDLAQVLGGNRPPRNAFIGRCMAAIMTVLQADFTVLWRDKWNDWQAYDVLRQQNIQLQLPSGKQMLGVARGIAENGCLIVEIDGRAHSFRQGQVRLWH